jgi:membrane-anchored protein YejM (alkaline phosphatase superfamily)
MGDAHGHTAAADVPATPFGRWAVPVVWALAAVGSALVVGAAYAGRSDWFGDTSPTAVYAALGMVLAASVIASMALQLASREPHGFVGRLSASIAGAVVAVAVAAVALLPVAL